MTSSTCIDAHVHLWDPSRNEDILILRHEPSLRRDANAAGLTNMLTSCALSHAIVIQSVPDADHVSWLLDIASRIDSIVGVVAWLNPSASDAKSVARKFGEDPRVCGVRLMLNRMEDPSCLLLPQAISILTTLADCQIAIECLTPSELIPLVVDLAERLPDANIVLDHGGLPGRDAMKTQDWWRAIATIGACQNVSSKLSGLMEPFGEIWSVEDLAPRVAVLLEAFGPDRLMRASNWPVVDLGGGSRRWLDALDTVLASLALNSSARQAIDYDSALRTYPRAKAVLLDQLPKFASRSTCGEKIRANTTNWEGPFR